MTTDDAVHGKIEVIYRGQTLHHLYLSSIIIKNHSRQDIENLDIKIFSGNKSTDLLTEETGLEGTNEFIPLADKYLQLIETSDQSKSKIRVTGTEDKAENERREDLSFKIKYRERHYVIPLLNRGQSARFNYVVNVTDQVDPDIYITCQTKGVRIKEKPYPLAISHLWGILVTDAARAGIVIGAIIYFLVIWLVSPLWVAAAICFLVGIFASVPGAWAIKSYRWLREKIIG